MPYYPEILLSSGNFRILDMLREGKGALYDQSKMTDEDLNGYKYQFQQGSLIHVHFYWISGYIATRQLVGIEFNRITEK